MAAAARTVTTGVLPLDYTSSCVPTYIHDGDTFATDALDLGFGIRMSCPQATHWLVRLAGVAARELHDDGGPEAKQALTALLGAGRVWLRTLKPDHYGNRVDAHVYLTDGTDVQGALLTQGWVVPWNGEGPQPKPAWPRTATGLAQ